MAAMRAAILLSLALAACASPGAAGAPGTPPGPVGQAAIAPRAAELRLEVQELSCHSCAKKVADGTAAVPGVLHVSTAILEHTLAVKYDPTRLTEAALIAAIDKVVESVVQ
jgi:copper chaperone CopZ